jgi:ABC-type sugar transport system ATPase subunit
MVYQDFALANNLDVTANIFLGRELGDIKLGPFRVMNTGRMEQEACATARHMGAGPRSRFAGAGSNPPIGFITEVSEHLMNRLGQ